MESHFPVVNTFIQFPTLRTSPVDDFVQERGTQSCPANRMLSLEDDPFGVLQDVECENDVVIQWPATRGPSMEDDETEEAGDQTFIAWPVTRDVSLEDNPVDGILGAHEAGVPSFATGSYAPQFWGDNVAQWPLTSGPIPVETFMVASPDQDACDLSMSTVTAVSNPPMISHGWFAMSLSAPEECMDMQSLASPPVGCSQATELQSFSLEEFISVKLDFNYDNGACDESTSASSADDDFVRELLLPSVSCDDKLSECKDASPALEISLSSCLGLWSAGSAEHQSGNCKPCGFFWKGNGCQKGLNCGFCHLCPETEVKKRKKDKLIARGWRSSAAPKIR
jgi:hypothetical protein